MGHVILIEIFIPPYLFFVFEAWRSPAEETQNIAPMRGSPTDSRICTKRSLNLPKVLSTFITETMGYKQAFLNLQYVDLVSGNVVLCRMVTEVVSVRGNKQLSVQFLCRILAIIGGQRRGKNRWLKSKTRM